MVARAPWSDSWLPESVSELLGSISLIKGKFQVQLVTSNEYQGVFPACQGAFSRCQGEFLGYQGKFTGHREILCEPGIVS